MSSLKQIKNKIRSIDKTRQVTKAMEAVSAVKMRKSQAAALESRPYALYALSILKRLSGSVDSLEHPLVIPRPVSTTGIIVITSDRGFAGSLNSAIFRRVHEYIRDKGLTKENLSLVCIGRKGYDHFSRRGFAILEQYERWGEGISLAHPEVLTNLVIDLYTRNVFDELYIAYTNFESTFRQNVFIRKVLPIVFDEVQKTVDGIIPKQGKFSNIERAPRVLPDRVHDYILEPSAESVLDELMVFMVNIQIFNSQLEANASEHSARMVAMKNASDKARDMSKELTRTYNKERQSTITREMSEIIGGMVQ